MICDAGTEQVEFDCSSFDISTATTTPVGVTCTLNPGYAVNAANTYWIVFTSTDSNTNKGEISFSNGASAPDNAGAWCLVCLVAVVVVA